MVAWDFRDAYMHLRLQSDFIRYVTIQVNGVYWEVPTLSFEWCNSPFYFTKLLRALVTFLRAPQDSI